MWARRLPAALAVALALAACSTSGGSKAVDLPSASGGGTFALSSTAFSDGGPIPARFTCDGQSLPPRLTWAFDGQPAEFVLVMTDPDAPGGVFVHWVMYGIPPNAADVGEGQGPPGARQGLNGSGQLGYAAPCPPAGDTPHHYVFTLYAVSQPKTSSIGSGATLEQVVGRISCCIEATATLTGTYGR